MDIARNMNIFMQKRIDAAVSEGGLAVDLLALEQVDKELSERMDNP